MTPYRICIVSEYPDSLMTGGLQVQAEETVEALQSQGVTAERFNWTGRTTPADLYHFIGFPPYLATVAKLVRQSGKPYVCTVLTGGLRHPLRRLKAEMKRLLERRLPFGREYELALRHAAAIITIIPQDALGLSRLYGLPRERIHTISHGVDARFAHATPELWHQHAGSAPFVLCVGAIQRRKNQLLLVKACDKLNLPVVLLGPVLPGERDYGRQVEEAMAAHAKRLGGEWLTDLDHDSALLTSAFAACRVFALLSVGETQPLSVMQAMAAQRPILLGDAEYCVEAPFNSLARVPVGGRGRVDAVLSKMWGRATPSELPPQYFWENVASVLRGLYERILFSDKPRR